MSALPRLKLGTSALTSQAAPAVPRAGIRRPEELRPGVEVWVYFRRWRPGIVLRMVRRDPAKAMRGAARGDLAVVAIDEARASNLTVQRPVLEVILATDAEPDSTDRESARWFAREWWIEHGRRLAPSL